jgi:hypothetical protein
MGDFITDFKKTILDLKDNIFEIQNTILGIKAGFTKFTKFFEDFFQVFPPELILLFLLTALLLVLINNVSPTTPKANITISVLGLSFLWGYLNHIITGEYKIFWVMKTAILLLLPLYILNLLSFGYGKILPVIRARFTRLGDLSPEMVESLHDNYLEYSRAERKKTENPAEYKKALENLRASIELVHSKINS